MTQATHTPGPWAVRRSSKGYPYQIHAPNGGHVKDITRWAAISVPSLKEGEANARLIAAAPDMLVALTNVRKLISEAALTGFNCADGDWADRLFASQQITSAAIRKAEGRTP